MKRESFDATARCKVPGTLARRLARIAVHRVKLPTEVHREALVEFVEKMERELGLPPMDEPEKEASAA